MRAWAPPILAFCAALAFAQNNNQISIPAGGLVVNAGQPLTIDWTDPSSSTVTIKLQQAPITPDSGVVLDSGIPASALTATFTIPSTVNTHLYTIEIIDDTDANNYNFSPSFGIQGATGTQTALVATSTGSASASSASSASGSSASSASASSISASSTSASSASSASASSSSASASSSNASASSSSASFLSASPTSQTTTAPSSAAVPLSIPGGFLAAVLGFAALL